MYNTIHPSEAPNDGHHFDMMQLLLLLLSSGAHILLKCSIRNLEAGKSAQTSTENCKEDDCGDDGHKDACVLSARSKLAFQDMTYQG